MSLSQPRRQWETADDGFTEPGGTRGSEVIERLLEDRHLEEVPADADTVDRLIATARRHIASATTSAESDPEGALALAYDASRNSATALLGHQGLRPTSAGRHIAVVDATNAQFPGVEGLKSIDRLRRRRNQPGRVSRPTGLRPGHERRGGRRHRRRHRLRHRRREAPRRTAARLVPLTQFASSVAQAPEGTPLVRDDVQRRSPPAAGDRAALPARTSGTPTGRNRPGA